MRSMEFYYYTSCVAQRTRLRRTKFQEKHEQGSSRRNKQPSAGFNEVKKKEMKKNKGHGSRKLGLASRSKGDSRKSVHGSKKSPDDIVEIDRYEFLKDVQSRKGCNEATNSNQNSRVSCSSLDVSSESGSFELEGTDDVDVDVFSENDCRTVERVVKKKDNRCKDVEVEKTKGNNHKGVNIGACSTLRNNTSQVEEIVVSSDSEENTEMEHSSFTVSLESGSFEAEGTDDEDNVEVFSNYDCKTTEKVIKKKDGCLKGVEVEKTREKKNHKGGNIAGASSRFRKNATEVEEIAVSSGSEDWDEFSSFSNCKNEDSDEHSFYSDSESEDSKDPDFVGESSSDSEEVNEETTEELISDKESEKSEDEGEFGETEALKMNDISSRTIMKPCLERKKTMLQSNNISSCDIDDGPVKKSQAKSLKMMGHRNKVSHEREFSEKHPLKMDEVLGKKKRGLENVSLCDVEEEHGKKRKAKSLKKCSEHMNKLSHERESYEKHALKRNGVLNRKIQKRLVSSPLSRKEEDGINSDGMHENRRLRDLDKTEKKHIDLSCVIGEENERKGEPNKKSRVSRSKGTDDQDNMEVFSNYDGKTTERVVKKKDSRFKDVEVEKTKGNNHKGASVGACGGIRNNTTEVEEIVVSSGTEDWDKYSSSSDCDSEDSNGHSFSSDSESENLKDSGIVVEEDSPSVSVGDLSSDSEEVNEESTDELISEKESENSEDKGDSNETEALKKNDISGRMSQKPVLVRKKRGPQPENIGSDESVKESQAKSLKKCSQNRNKVSHERECCEKPPLKTNEVFGKKKKGRENISLCNSDEEPVKKRKAKSLKKCSEHMNKLSHERECTDKHALKRNEVLSRKIQKRLVSSPQSNEEEDEIKSDGMHENSRLRDLDKMEKKHADVSCVNGEENARKGKPSKKGRVSGPKDNILSAMLENILGIGETEEGEALKAAAAAKPSSPEVEQIPLKFRFEDEDELQPTKTEFELMVDGLFDEMEYAKQLECNQMSSSKPPTDEKEEQAGVSDDELNQYDRCRSGNHGELYFDEPVGLICSFCEDLVLESKFVLADLVYPTTASRRNSCRENEFFSSYDLELEASESVSRESCNLSRGTVWDIIPGVREQMYSHQQEGFEFIWQNLTGTIDLSELKNSDLNGGGGCIISHAPGTGKTRLTIVFLETFLKLFPNSRPVIVAPVSILLTWEEEFKKWDIKFPFLNLNNLESSGHENLCLDTNFHRALRIKAWKKGASVLGVSYNLFEKLAGEKFNKEKGTKKKRDKNLEMLRSILLEMPGLVVLDEGHTARNQRSSIWNALSNLKTEKCVILSGTPFQNNFGELFNTLSLVRPTIADKLAKEKAFDDTVRLRKIFPNSRTLDEAIDKLKATIAPFVHVHKGSILQKSLPGLKDCVVLLHPPPLQKNLIEALENLQKQNTFEFEHKVAMISVHPSLILQCKNLSEKEKSAFDQEQLEKLRLDYGQGVKTRFLMELVRLSIALGEKVLVFSQYVLPLELIKDHLKSVFHWTDGKELLHMGGKLDQKHRQKLINVFNNPDSEAKVMLASTKCCSEGINLVGASRVVLLDVVWNPSVERQAISRAYRLGQKRVVYTYHLMTSGTTEGEKYCRQAQKDRISELVFSASSTMEGIDTEKYSVTEMDDKILEDMVGHKRLKDMFKKIIYQPKESNLIQSFGPESISTEK